MSMITGRDPAIPSDCRRMSLARLGIVFVAALALAGSPASAQTPAQRALEAKVELLYRITKFIEWPRQAFQGDSRQITLAIFGEDELAVELVGRLSTRTVNGRDLFVRCVLRPEDARGCQILFIAASEEKRIPQILQALQGASVLTVADTSGFASRGGMVDFLLDGDRVHFQINRQRVEKARLKISAKLLALAQIVSDES